MILLLPRPFWLSRLLCHLPVMFLRVWQILYTGTYMWYCTTDRSSCSCEWSWNKRLSHSLPVDQPQLVLQARLQEKRDQLPTWDKTQVLQKVETRASICPAWTINFTWLDRRPLKMILVSLAGDAVSAINWHEAETSATRQGSVGEVPCKDYITWQSLRFYQ